VIVSYASHQWLWRKGCVALNRNLSVWARLVGAKLLGLPLSGPAPSRLALVLSGGWIFFVQV
jgi:hypothetical protein